LGLIVALTRWAIEDWITESYGLLWHNHSAAVAQTETMPKKKAAPSYRPFMTLMTASKMRHNQYTRFHCFQSCHDKVHF